MDNPTVRTTLLWVHALSGAMWAGAAACFVIATATIGAATKEGRDFARRTAPKINRFGLGALAILLLSGILNLYLAGIPRRFRFSATFIEVLGAKVALFLGMAVATLMALRSERRLAASDSPLAQGELAHLLWSNGIIAAMGAIALVLGLWLAGS